MRARYPYNRSYCMPLPNHRLFRRQITFPQHARHDDYTASGRSRSRCRRRAVRRCSAHRSCITRHRCSARCLCRAHRRRRANSRCCARRRCSAGRLFSLSPPPSRILPLPRRTPTSSFPPPCTLPPRERAARQACLPSSAHTPAPSRPPHSAHRVAVGGVSVREVHPIRRV